MSRAGDRPRAIRVVVVSDTKLYREAVRHVFDGHPRVSVVGTAGRREELMDCLAKIKPDAVLLDSSTCGSATMALSMARRAPRVRVVVFALREDDDEIHRYAAARVAGYVLRSGSPNDLALVLESVTHGQTSCVAESGEDLSYPVSALLARPDRPAGSQDALTARQTEIVRLIDQGRSNKEIAGELGIEVTTVKNHVHNVLRKLHANRRGEAAALMRTV